MSEQDNEKSWNICLLGSRRTGKTVYLGGLYHYYGDTDNNYNNTPFYIYPSNSEGRAMLGDFASGIGRKPPILPAGTIGLKPFPIELNVEFETYSNTETITKSLNIIDHEGKALLGSDDENEAENFDEIIKKMKTYDAFICFLSCEHLLNSDLIDQYAAWNVIKNIIKSVSSKIAFTAGSNDFLPVTIVISKFDLAEKEEREEEIIDKVSKLIKKFSKQTPNVAFMICPMNVLRVDEQDEWEEEPQPSNIAAPFLFTSKGVILRNAVFLKEQAKAQRRQSVGVERRIERRKKENKGVFGFFKRLIPDLVDKIAIKFLYDKRINRYASLSQSDFDFADEAFRTLEKISNRGSLRFIYQNDEIPMNVFVSKLAREAGLDV